jgi:DnaB-like helicase C terminal domain/Bacteriophage T7 DNA helicase/primase, N-terminal a+b fold/Toprim-like
MADFLRHEACPSCNSKNNLARYADGSAYCFGCQRYEHADGKIEEHSTNAPKEWAPIPVDVRAVPKRGLTAETCEAWGYGYGETKEGICHVASYKDERGKLVAQKLRFTGKKFKILGNGKDMPLYGMWKFSGGKHLVITEGEIDALSVSQAMDNKWPVVSLPNGAQSAEKAITNAYTWLDKFERIVLMFDMDAPGQEAAEKVAALLPPGKAAIAILPHKDANEVLQAEGPGAIIRAFWNAPQWRPDGIRHVADLEDAFLNPPEVRGIPYPWKEWNEVLGLMRLGALVTLTAGTGIGKSTLMRELVHYTLVTQKEPVGALFLEEDNVETLDGIVGIEINKNIAMDRKLATPEEIKVGFEKIKKLPLYVYDHFGSSDVDNICDKIRYLVKACGCRWIFLDHISILVSGLDGDERRTIDMAMTKLRTLVSELKCGMFCVVHLKRPQGDKGHEDGAEVHLGQLRGSHSIAQLSDAVIALNKDEKDPHGTNVYPVCMKNRRNGGRKGPMGMLAYDRDTGRLNDCPF